MAASSKGSQTISSVSDIFLPKKHNVRNASVHLAKVAHRHSTKLHSVHSLHTQNNHGSHTSIESEQSHSSAGDSVRDEVFDMSLTYLPAKSSHASAGTYMNPSESEKIPSESEKIPSESGNIPSESDNIPSESDNISSESDDIPSESNITYFEEVFVSDRFTKAEHCAVMSVLENTVDQLEILRHLLPHSFDKYEDYETLEERHGRPEPTHVLPEEGVTAQENALMKVQRDRLYAESVIVRTAIDLKKNNRFNPLEEAISNAQQMDEEDAFLLVEAKQNEEEVMRLRHELSSLQAAKKEAVETTELAVMQLKDQIHETMLQTGIRTRYVTKWEMCRQQQQHYDNSGVEKGLHDRMDQIFIDMDNEHRTNQEIETYITMTKQEIEDSIEKWMELYDRETEERDRSLMQLKMEREVHMRDLVELQTTFDSHQKEMDEWKAKKEERRIRAEREAFLNKMATRIQAWWRGTMYRKKLGPYRKKKKKGKGAKGKGKGKGGKKGGSQKGKSAKKK